MKLFYLFLLPLLITSCAEHKNTPAVESAAVVKQPDELKVGGIYLFKNKDNSYYITKVLVLDDFAVHVRTYKGTFKIKPVDINTEKLEVLIGHAPLDKNGFLMDKPELLKEETVKESELEGYKLYMEAMSK